MTERYQKALETVHQYQAMIASESDEEIRAKALEILALNNVGSLIIGASQERGIIEKPIDECSTERITSKAEDLYALAKNIIGHRQRMDGNTNSFSSIMQSYAGGK